MSAGRAAQVDNLVLGTVNAPWKRSIDADTLATGISTGQIDDWLPHMATFFGEVRASLIVEFACAHGISRLSLATCYESVIVRTGERNFEFELVMTEQR